MSDAIRCGQCRWWREHEDADGEGVCELNPSRHVDGDPTDAMDWFQPRTLSNEGCSRGEPKTEEQA